MARKLRMTPGGLVYHVINRGVRRMKLFETEKDYHAFEKVLEEVWELFPMRICSYSIMPNHWHMILWPRDDQDLSKFMHRLTVTHAARWQLQRQTVGEGHVYQGRFKAFPIGESHIYRVLRYVEQNALRANLVSRAEEWRWSSLWRRTFGTDNQKQILHSWPVPQPDNWLQDVQNPLTKTEYDVLKTCVENNVPYGDEIWKAMLGTVFHVKT
jgi:putative transposase